ncbi:molybdopterin converting factor subunit 1 [Natronospirillum operosum]|uniref:Molybdopterin synthase sulfur carrier subunit n=1 Tax=Natronospirillum operosum TaxID=2759953 RepID=A0A4Z0W553_9GAMM|nr:molybdopterin converting factor subunit 1 [Natronospirillum operosum]TGG92772.1 molybdopterin converting factor subunit 1 [Natronospirillum operosum]
MTSAAEPSTAAVTVLFFARLREELPQPRLHWPWSEAGTVNELRRDIAAQGNDWAALTEDLLVAVNQEMAGPEQTVKPGDEVAFFPPVTGG